MTFHYKFLCSLEDYNYCIVNQAQYISIVILYFSQVDYQCFDFVPRHHNVIRFRKGVAMIMDDFQTVCSWVQFKNDAAWKYDLMLSKLLYRL